MKTPPASAAPTEQSIEKMLNTIRIPPRPSLLSEVQQELACADPSPQKLAHIIAQDVAMAGALLKLANSAYIGLKLKAKSVEQAVNRLGIEQCSLLLTGIVMRETFHIEGVSLTEFWDNSTRRAQAMSYLAKKMTLCRSDIAHTFGLFCNIGVPLLLAKYPNYYAVLETADPDQHQQLAVFEEQHFNTSHAALGALMARTWGLPDEVVEAILLHHHYAVLHDHSSDSTVRNLIALALLVDYGIHRYYSQQQFPEWEAGGAEVCAYLGMSQSEADDISDEVNALFDVDLN
ncbi:HDOD domain-containing protein [Solimicrobium silvestre]|uniref:Putative signal transduction protein n=1 Tax=Solimicrobium silvestre TaxID=2099400 RepID=A0A2S9H3P9_9BURK|nr:HDOD domain-containing protein [Solimicrobium silvestre]PRC94614.1 putative signal transduction protein [Solimicrobium silvestre]